MLEPFFTIILYVIFFATPAIQIVRFAYKEYKEYKKFDDTEKTIAMITIIAFLFPIITLIMDLWNIPTKFGLLKNIDANNWHNFFGTYFSTLISTLLSTGFLILITFKQLNCTYQDNDKLGKEQLRLQNIPVLKFSCNNTNVDNSKYIVYVDCNEETKNNEMILTLEIKNVGLGTAQNIQIQIIVGIENNEQKMGQENQIIEINETIKESIKFEMPINHSPISKELTILVFYDDLLANKYVQKLEGTISQIYDNRTKQYSFSGYVNSSGKYEEIGENYQYKIPQEKIKQVLDSIEYKEKMNALEKIIPQKKEIDSIIIDFFNSENKIYKIIKSYLEKKECCGDSYKIMNYKKIKEELYLATVIYEYGINHNESVKIECELEIDLANKKLKKVQKKVIESTININKRNLNKLKKAIEKC